MSEQPSTNGRDGRGRFASGNRIGRGNPFGTRAAKLRAAVFRTVRAADLREVVQVLLREAKNGAPWAIRELLSRTLGPPVELDVLTRLEDLEGQLQETRR